MSKISVVIPVYGVEKFIKRCAHSLFQQSLDDIEYIFIDDCTLDNSITILSSVLESYPERKEQVIVHRMQQNSGQAAVRKWGIQHASGDYIIHCDSDDWIDTNMYQSMYNIAIKNNSDIVICDYLETDGSNYQKLHRGSISDNKNIYLYMLQCKLSWSLWNKLVKRQLYENNIIFPIDSNGEDMALMLQLMYYAKRVDYIPKAFYNYYINPLSITKSSSEEQIFKRFKQGVNNAKIVEQFVASKYDNRVYKQALDRIKYHQRELLEPLITYDKYYDIWKATFTELHSRFWLNQHFGFKQKIKFYLRLIGLIR